MSKGTWALVGVGVFVVAVAANRRLRPGVYVDEVPSSSKPIEGVGTAVAAFLGFAPKRPPRGGKRDGDALRR